MVDLGERRLSGLPHDRDAKPLACVRKFFSLPTHPTGAEHTHADLKTLNTLAVSKAAGIIKQFVLDLFPGAVCPPNQVVCKAVQPLWPWSGASVLA